MVWISTPRHRLQLLGLSVWHLEYRRGGFGLLPRRFPSYPATTAGQFDLHVALVAFLAVAASTIVVTCAPLRQPSRVKPGGTRLAVSVLALLPLLFLGP